MAVLVVSSRDEDIAIGQERCRVTVSLCRHRRHDAESSAAWVVQFYGVAGPSRDEDLAVGQSGGVA